MKPVVFLLFFMCIIPNVFPCGKKEVKSAGAEGRSNTMTNNVIKITGRVAIFGSEPHTFAGIVDENGTEFAVYPPEQEAKLRKLQGYLIEFTVVFLDEPKGEGALYLKGGTVNPLEWSIIR